MGTENISYIVVRKYKTWWLEGFTAVTWPTWFDPSCYHVASGISSDSDLDVPKRHWNGPSDVWQHKLQSAYPCIEALI